MQSFGSLRQAGWITVQDNLRGDVNDEYDGAIVERAMLSDDKLAWFNVKYFRARFPVNFSTSAVV